MSAVLDLNRLRRTRRFPVIPGIDTDHWGTGAVDEGALQPRIVTAPPPAVDLQPQPDGSYSLDAPPQRIFSEGAPAPVLEAPTILRRTLTLTPPAEEMPSEALAPIPDAALLARRRYTKPEFQRTGDEAADRTRYGQSLSDWKDPADRNGRLKSFGLGALRGALRGLAVGGLGGALGGAVAGGIHGAAAPNADEREWRDAQLADTQQKLGTLQARRIADLKLRGMEADVSKTEAEAKALLSPKPKEPKLFQGRDGAQYRYDPDTQSAVLIPGQGEKAATPKVLRTTVRGGKVWYETEEGLKPALDPTTGEQLAEPMREVTLGGQTFNVPETEAARILGGVEAANVAARGQYANQTYGDTVEAQRRADENQKRLRSAAEAEAKAWNAEHDKLDDLVAQHRAEAAESQPDVALLTELRSKIQTAKERLSTTGAAINAKYPGLLNFNAAERFEVTPPPQLSAPPPRQAPPRRSVSVAPRQSAPKTPPVSIDAYLATARERLGANFDEAQARAAYRRRYGR